MFRLEPERAHRVGLWAISKGLVRGRIIRDDRLCCRAFGKDLKHPLGLAAGFDKGGVAADRWQALGFSFAEIGTVTPLAQEGNPKPRIFRLAEDEALINRLGFNSEGAGVVRRRLEARTTRSPVGVNIGKSANTPLSEAAGDYAAAFRLLKDCCDYVVINVSSPNTPGLRELQGVERLRQVLHALKQENSQVPLFVKLSPDLEDQEVAAVTELAVAQGLSGIVATNTTLSREGLISARANEAGGLSGRPLRKRAEELCRLVRSVAGDRLEIIGVGGIFTGDDLFERLRSGANVCQIYTSLVYRGPNAAAMILEELLQRMHREGARSVPEIQRS